MLSTFGRIGRDAELRYTPSGTPVANIALAYNYGRKGEDGNRPTQWLEIAVWGKQAEGLAKFLTKGKQIHVSVREVHIETFTKNDGSQGIKLVGDLADIKFASSGAVQDQPAQQQQATRTQPVASTNTAQPQPDYDSFDDDIPF